MIEKYLSLRKRLHEVIPESSQARQKIQDESRGRAHSKATSPDHGVDRQIDQLTARLNKIKRDILFDETEAERRWAEIRIDLAKENAERKRLGIHDGVTPKSQATPIEGPNEPQAFEEDEDDTDLLRGLFTGLSASQSDQDAGTNGAAANGEQTVRIREFGKWTGMSPRRIFEEACRSR